MRRVLIGGFLCLGVVAPVLAGDRCANNAASDSPARAASAHGAGAPAWRSTAANAEQQPQDCRGSAQPLDSPSSLPSRPQARFDNTPWRFEMSQNGKRMTADEFSAWMRARGLRVAKGAAGAARPPAADVEPDRGK